MYDELGAHTELIAMGPTPIVPAPQTHKTNRVDSKQDRQDKRDTDAPAAKKSYPTPQWQRRNLPLLAMHGEREH